MPPSAAAGARPPRLLGGHPPTSPTVRPNSGCRSGIRSCWPSSCPPRRSWGRSARRPPPRSCRCARGCRGEAGTWRVRANGWASGVHTTRSRLPCEARGNGVCRWHILTGCFNPPPPRSRRHSRRWVEQRSGRATRAHRFPLHQHCRCGPRCRCSAGTPLMPSGIPSSPSSPSTRARARQRVPVAAMHPHQPSLFCLTQKHYPSQ